MREVREVDLILLSPPRHISDGFLLYCFNVATLKLRVFVEEQSLADKTAELDGGKFVAF